MTAEQLRHTSGGVIGHFTPKEVVVDFKSTPELGTVGDHKIDLRIPKNRFLVGAYIKNDTNDLAGGAGFAVKVGEVEDLPSGAQADVKGNGVAVLLAEPVYGADVREVELTVSTAAATAGKLTVGVIYA
jgi:hypothetical protein